MRKFSFKGAKEKKK